jgi:hypothetical protein
MTPDEHGQPDVVADPLEARARRRLKQKRDFAGHLLVYIMVNGFLVIIWAITSGGFFWPVFPIVGWGIGVVMNAWDVWRNDDFTDAEIHREMARLKQHDAR